MSWFLGTAITYTEDIKRVREDEIKKRRSKKAISFFGKMHSLLGDRSIMPKTKSYFNI